MLQLKFDVAFEDLLLPSGLQKIDEKFISYLTEENLALADEYIEYRSKSKNLSSIEESDLLIKVSIYLDDFIALLFDIEADNDKIKSSYKQFNLIYECKRKFIQRYALKKYPQEVVKYFSGQKVSDDLASIIGELNQENIIQNYVKWQTNIERYQSELDILAQYCAYMVYSNNSLPLFDIPQNTDPENLIRKNKIDKLKQHLYLGFDYRDREISNEKAFAESKYCLHCHLREKDSCKTGFKNIDHANLPEKNGCPLEQRISEMALLQSQGFNIAALSLITIDNPMVAATGHRICNDCMKSCIYQKQDPVNIPIIESNILQQVLSLPWGVEIYLLLTKWNPLNIKQPLPFNDSGYNILVVGLGPAGFALSHYLLNLGHKVMAIDGLKIADLPFDINKPIKFWQDIKMPLHQRKPQGFGGVAEYGITNRWDKNNLTLIRLILERRANFILQDNVRLGSNITTEQAFEQGFHHIALCVGAGKPRYSTLPGFFAKGVRPAADFLMNLQQGGAFLDIIPNPIFNCNIVTRRSPINIGIDFSRLVTFNLGIGMYNTRLSIRMPAVVIGCGLTAIDSAVELMHYYPIQVERFVSEWERKNIAIETLAKNEQEIVKEFIHHRNLFCQAKNIQDKIAVMKQIGGVTICYRKSVSESPAYNLNHEEVEHAMAIGIDFEEYFTPTEILTDNYGHAKSIISKENKQVHAKTILVAIGTENNSFIDIKGLNIDNDELFKNDQKNISYFGDCNQKYAGSVVKALASAKKGYNQIDHEIRKLSPKHLKINIDDFNSKISTIKLISKNLLEIQIYSPYIAQNFRPGQFFKLQNYAKEMSGLIKPIALTGITVDRQTSLITLCVFNSWNVIDIYQKLSVGQKVALMGPVGSPLFIPKGQKVILIANDFNNIALISIAKSLVKNNCQIVYFANYSTEDALYYRAQIQEFADKIIWSSPDGSLKPLRKGDLSFTGSLIDSIIAAKKNGLISDVDRVICYVSPEIRKSIYPIKNQLFGVKTPFTCSIYSSMQCMMKGICGQCITQNHDGGNYVFTCIKQFEELS